MDVNTMNPRLYELYQEDCRNKGISTSIHDYLLWFEDEGYLDIPEEVYAEEANVHA